MCNLYSINTSADAIRRLFDPVFDFTNAAIFDEKIYPDYHAPVVRNNLDGSELTLCRWGMPSPPANVKSNSDNGITNVRDVASFHWKKWLGVGNRCIVPANAFSEYGQTPDPKTNKKPLHWFALNDRLPLFFFAGIWTDWIGVRKATEGAQNHALFAFLTCEPNTVVEPIRVEAMPVILTEPEEIGMWMNAEWEVAKELQRPLSANELMMIC